MKKKLLNRPLKAFTIYALIVLVCSIPMYYFVIDAIWIEELDQHNLIIKQRIEKHFEDEKVNENELAFIFNFWDVLQPGTKLIPIANAKRNSDSVYTVTKGDENDRFRGLLSTIFVNGKSFQLTVETNVEEVDETLLAIALVTFLFFSLMVTGFIILNRKMAKKIWKPFRNTLDKVKKFDLQKNQNIHFEKSDIEEFDELNVELNKLIENNIIAFNRQKTFIENASHELQTPLAVLKSKVEMLMQNEQLSEKQAEIINAIQIPLARVSRINKNLLLLAKIENNQFIETETIELSVLLHENLELLSDYIDAKKLTVKVKLNQQIALVSNQTLMEILLNNLLINAIIHSTENSEILINISGNKITISNSGIAALNHKTIFNRFVVSSTNNTNSGLGLAIAKEICNRYQWNLTYSFVNNYHEFSVKFE